MRFSEERNELGGNETRAYIYYSWSISGHGPWPGKEAHTQFGGGGGDIIKRWAEKYPRTSIFSGPVQYNLSVYGRLVPTQA